MSDRDDLWDDIVNACAHLAERSGAVEFQIGFLSEDVPLWYAHAKYQGTRIITQNHESRTAAALALSQRLLDRAGCRCGQTVTLVDGRDGCRWRLVGARWEPGCDAPPITVHAHRGNLQAMGKAFLNRQDRRKPRG